MILDVSNLNEKILLIVINATHATFAAYHFNAKALAGAEETWQMISF